MSTFWLVALIFAVIVVAALAFYAGKLLKQLAQQTKQQEAAEKAKQQAYKKHDTKILNSVVIITKAMQEEQCDFSEGCWRLSVLLDSLKLSNQLDQKFPAIFELYNEIKNLSILENRKELTKKQRMREDYQRMTAETKLYEKIVEDLVVLKTFTDQELVQLSVE